MVEGRYEDAIVRVVRWAPGMPTAGLGLLVGARQVVTCAHVVNMALDKPLRDPERPGEQELVTVEFPFLNDRPVRQGRVVAWRPPSAQGIGPDIAGLMLTEEAPGVVLPARLTTAGQIGASLRVYGYPSTPPRPDAVPVNVELKGRVPSGLQQVESRSDQSIKAQPGFSGSPVWDEHARQAVGLLTATALVDEPYTDAYLVPADLVAEVWEEPFDYLLIPPNPYRGLSPFTEADRPDFYGREEDIARLTERVRQQATVAVVGASGVGKSSLVLAGLLPALEQERSRSVVVFRPGHDPWQRLANGLVRAASGNQAVSAGECDQMIARLQGEGLAPLARWLRSEERPLVVVVDQFEELLAADARRTALCLIC
jgi:Trypsin-like peptidase domain/AAA ATPase domain